VAELLRSEEKVMSAHQIDRLCTDWLTENCGREVSSKYMPWSLVIPILNTPDLNVGLETLRQVLCIAFGADESFGTTDYHEARRKVGLLEDTCRIPDVFIKAFTRTGSSE
jgi:hypothetical protein